ncbi:NTP hydrolase p-loop-containing [Desulfonema limicola]|uniref:NTP hydrolase p-loop-containing n=1 Tax=Desulfonema limicola TaxID=45656 RepID=A0A975B4J1_9BACT|nr:RNase adapter RapZ [Desulfonema limicola]QTA78624.1 NTP hydrolase p-loop-containing [Desulfonema limicola]
MKNLKIVIITGLSGSGKSTALAAFEDAGFYCVDNMPVILLPKLLELPIESASEITGLAFVMDLREKQFLSQYLSVFEELKAKGYLFKILFLEADEKILMQRFSQTRRYHPLAKDKGLAEGIMAEKNLLKDLRESSDQLIDTSRYTVHDLKAMILGLARENKKRIPMRINIMSFGFKFGIPHDADLVMDVRFLANPYFIPELKSLNGETKEIQDFVLKRDETKKFISKYLDFIDFLIPLYEKEGKAYLTLGIGCTGGKHRSVAVACSIFNSINTPERWVNITHRDIGKN